MIVLSSPRFLRAVLAADAASGAAIAAAHLLAPGWLARWLGLPQPLLTAAGLVLLGCVALAGWLATRPLPPRNGVLLLATANLAWTLGCLGLLFAGIAATGLGQAYLAVQALAVGLLAQLQWLAVRQPAAGRVLVD